MDLLKSFYFLLFLTFVSCTNKHLDSNNVEQNRTDSALQDIVDYVHQTEDSVFFSQNFIVLKDVIFKHDIIGKTVNLGSFINLDYDNALVTGDTLIVVTKEEKVLPLIDFNEIKKPMTEKQITDLMGDGYKLLKTVEDWEIENNTDGNYEPPYLFYIKEQDTISYMITSPNESTFEFCEAKFCKKSHNVIAKKIFSALSELHMEKFAKKYPYYKYVWFIQTETNTNKPSNPEEHSWSVFVSLNDFKIKKVSLVSDGYERSILINAYMSEYMYGF